jgi:hypothetical protein
MCGASKRIAEALAPVIATPVATQFGETPSGKFPEGSEPGRARDKVAVFAGISGRTVEKIRAVRDAAKAEPGENE